MTDLSGSDLTRLALRSGAADASTPQGRSLQATIEDLPPLTRSNIKKLISGHAAQTYVDQAKADNKAAQNPQGGGRHDPATKLGGQVTAHEGERGYIVRTEAGDLRLTAPSPQDRPRVDRAVALDLPRDPAVLDKGVFQVRVQTLPKQNVPYKAAQLPPAVEVHITPVSLKDTPSAAPPPDIAVRLQPAPDDAVITVPQVVSDVTAGVKGRPFAEALLPIPFPAGEKAASFVPATAPLLQYKVQSYVPLADHSVFHLAATITEPPALPPHIARYIVQPAESLRANVTGLSTGADRAPVVITAPAGTAAQVQQSAPKAEALHQIYARPAIAQIAAPVARVERAGGVIAIPQAVAADSLPRVPPDGRVAVSGVAASAFISADDIAAPLITSTARAGDAVLSYVGRISVPDGGADLVAVRSGRNSDTPPPLAQTAQTRAVPDHNKALPPSAVQAATMMNDAKTAPPLSHQQGGLFTLHGALPALPVGASVVVTPYTPQPVAADQSTRGAVPTLPPDVAALPVLGPILLQAERWPALNDVYQALQASAPKAAQVLAGITPSATQNPAQIMPAVLFFVAALRGGDLSQWLGEKAVDALKRTPAGEKALSGLMSEGDLLSRLATERSQAEWRSFPLPYYQDEQFHKILLHVRDREQDTDSSGRTGKTMRFIFDLALDRIGETQLDGLFYDGGRLDVILRTQQRFSPAMQQEMRRIYAGALEQAGVYGELAFQNNLDQFVEVRYR